MIVASLDPAAFAERVGAIMIWPSSSSLRAEGWSARGVLVCDEVRLGFSEIGLLWRKIASLFLRGLGEMGFGWCWLMGFVLGFGF